MLNIFKLYIRRQQRKKRQRAFRVLTKSIPPVLCVDVGASYYPHTAWMPFLKSAQTTWVAVEPNFENVSYAKKWEYAARIQVCETGLSRHGGSERLYVTATDSGSSLYPPEIHPSFAHRGLDLNYFFPFQEKTINTITLEDLIKPFGSEIPTFVKLDTQGSELDILLGAENRLQHNQILGIELESPMIAHPVMKGSKKFWEVNREMERFGYELLETRTIPSGSFTSSEIKIGKRPVWECDSVFALQRDRAMGLPREFKAALVVFYLAYEYFEEAYAFLRDDRETRDFMGQSIGEDPLVLCGVLLGLHG